MPDEKNPIIEAFNAYCVGVNNARRVHIAEAWQASLRDMSIAMGLTAAQLEVARERLRNEADYPICVYCDSPVIHIPSQGGYVVYKPRVGGWYPGTHDCRDRPEENGGPKAGHKLVQEVDKTL